MISPSEPEAASPSKSTSNTTGKSKRRTPTERDSILDTFENSGMTASKFAAQHGIKYSTFITWQRRRKIAKESASNTDFTFLDVTPDYPHQSVGSPPSPTSISINMIGSTELTLHSEDQVPLVAALIKALA